MLLDAHALIWAVDEPSRLGAGAIAALQDPANELVISAGTIWELAIKTGIGKLSLSMPYRAWMEKAIADLRAIVLPITVEFAEAQAALPHHHRDPFDRLLAAQAQLVNMPLISGDRIFDQYGIARIWN